MSEQHRIAIILARNDPSAAALTVEQVRRMFVSDQSSVLRYWRENAENWFTFPLLDFFGPYDVALPAPPANRKNALDAAVAAAQNAGVDLTPYDGYVVFLHPGTALGVGYDAGGIGAYPGVSCVLPTVNDRTFFCHELGHLLGFDHTFGIETALQDDDGVFRNLPAYGSPYDLMSSARFGDASPTFDLPPDQTIANFPNGLKAGPMLSRANLHFCKPAALEATNKVRHIFEGGTDLIFTLYPAGQGDPGKPELIVYHPANEDASARGRVYVEYRQPFSFNWASRWDAGLGTSGTDRDNCGLVVHIVKDVPNRPGTVAVWYAGRLAFPNPDCDLEFPTPRGSVTVTVSNEFVQEEAPAFVRVRINRQHFPHVSIQEKASEMVLVLSSEMRPIPGWEWAGVFTWERRQTFRTVTYTPVVGGRGGAGSIDRERSNVSVNWYVGADRPDPPQVGVTSVMPPGGGPSVDIEFAIDPVTRALTLMNRPSEAAYAIPVRASASDEETWQNPISGDTAFSADGITEGWGADYKRFMDLWDRIAHPIPERRFKHPEPDDYRVGIDRLIHAYDALQQASPEVAMTVQTLVLDQMRVLQRMALR